MGLGKTIAALTVFARLQADFEAGRALVVTTKWVVENRGWSTEAALWEHTRHLRVVHIDGDPQQRTRALHEPGDVYVVNGEQLEWTLKEGAKLQKRKGPRLWDMLILDEAHKFKGHDSNRFKVLRALMKQAPNAITRVLELTGTPSPHSYNDLWSQLYLLDQGARLGKNITAFRTQFCTNQSRNATYQKWVVTDDAKDEIRRRVADIALSMRATEHLAMPELISRTHVVQLDDDELVEYNRAKRSYVLDLPDKVITAANAGVLAGKLLQAAGGMIYDDKRVPRVFHDHKIKALVGLVESLNGAPVLVSYQYQHEKARILEALPQAVALESKADIDRWNRQEIEVLLAHPASAGAGLNLQAGGNQIIWFAPTWNFGDYEQFNARLWRQGQKNPYVVVHHILSGCTIDLDAMNYLASKGLDQLALLRAVKAEEQDEAGSAGQPNRGRATNTRI